MSALADIKARALQARTFKHRIEQGDEACEFTLLTPTMTQAREVMRQHGLHRSEADSLMMPLLRHYLLLNGVTGWSGVRVVHALGDAAGADAQAPLPWSADATEVLLDAQPEWAAELGNVLIDRLNARHNALEQDAKN
jgi:hypothetical protein